METLSYLILIGVFVLILFRVKSLNSLNKNISEYTKIAEKKWITPNGFVDLDNPQLTPVQEFNNMQNEWQKESDEIKYQADLAYAKWKQQRAQYSLMIERVKKISPKAKWRYFHKAWIDYVNEWNKTATKYDREWRFMCLDEFIAKQIIPYKSYGFEIVFRPVRVYIQYV